MEQLLYLPASMIWPLLACLVLTGIHVYLGVHVIARKVIFVDLALAQIAALGTVVGVLLGYEVGKDTTALYLYSLAFTIFGAFVFSVTRMKAEKVPHEAIIGIVYAVTFAATILVLSKSALGPQELDHIIKGELLWVQSATVVKTAIIYAAVGVFHFVFRRNFMAISFDAGAAEASGLNVRLWDFLFYMSFGFVITSSVAIAGVFLVFSYLVIPSVGAMLLSDKLSTRLAIGWIGGAIISFAGVKASYTTGLPTSPLIVVFLATALIGAGLYRYLKVARSKPIALRNLAAATVVIGIFAAGVFLLRKPDEDPLEHTLHMLESRLSTDRQAGLANLTAFTAQQDEWLPHALELLDDQDAAVRRAAIELVMKLRVRSAVPHIVALLRDQSDDVKQSAIRALAALGGKSEGTALLQQSRIETDPELRSNMLMAALHVGESGAIPPLIEIMASNGIFADDAYEALRSHIALEFTSTEPARIRRWWDAHRDSIRFDPTTRLYLTPS
jgi:zinc/manganese transport system permease protein